MAAILGSDLADAMQWNPRPRFIAGHAHWLEQLGEVELIGGWAQVALDDDFAARIGGSDYLVFVISYDPVQLFVQNRSVRSFEIHALPGPKGGRRSTLHCGYRVVGWCAGGSEEGVARSAK